MKKVTIYTISDSPPCLKAKEYFKDQSIDFQEVDLTHDHGKASSLARQTGYSTVPQIKIDDKFIIGFDKKKIDELLQD